MKTSDKVLSDFSLSVIKVIKKIPKGKVLSYGQVAALAGKPRAARRVVWILHACSESHQLPWQRVVNAKGEIAFPVGSSHFKKQKKLLTLEGVRFAKRNKIDLSQYGQKRSSELEFLKRI